ncbi:AAA family ATPase [Pseudomonas sp. NPDC089401]|uniref:AAA family ATPase n=1 Tax=Pseudomonas sp. NPDC089401 TaxID=3364462 RepID=UPI003818AF79
MKITKVEIEGFRAYQLKKDGTFDFTIDGEKPSNFVAIYAPNGFGKSSFYDAVEWAFTDNLERYTGEHNKKNNAIAAKGTKMSKVAQKILRNKEVSDDVPTQVAVFTTVAKFERVLKKPNSNSADLKFPSGKNKKNEDVDLYKRIILSQDAIDRFLREAKPQERYDLFMGFFGGETEEVRQELTTLLMENKLQIDALQSERGEIEQHLKDPVDDSIFEEYNKLARDLNDEGESISLVDENFNAQAEHQILSSLVTRTHSLNANQIALKQRRGALIDQLSRLPELKTNLESVVSEKSYLAHTSKAVQDSVNYNALAAAHSRFLADWQAANADIQKLDLIAAQIPSFLTDEKLRAESAAELPNLNAQKAQASAELKTTEASIAHFRSSGAEADQREAGLRSMLANSPAVYSEIASHEAGLVALKSDLNSKFTSVQLITAERNKVSSDLEKIYPIQVTVDLLLRGDTSYLNLPDDFILKTHAAHEELSALRLHEERIKTTQAALSQQMEAVQRLVSEGISYLTKWPSDTCPLCRLRHQSPEDLRSAVKNNDLLSQVARQNAQELEGLALRINKLSDQIEANVTFAKNKHAERVAVLRSKLNELSAKITEGDNQKGLLAANINAAEQTIQALQPRVWGVNSQELHRRVEAELTAMSANRPIWVQQLAAAESSASVLRAKIQELDFKISSLKNSIEGVVSKPDYNSVKQFASQEAVLNFDELSQHCTQRKITLVGKLSELSEKMEKLLVECRELQDIMTAEGSWVDFALLESAKNSAARQLNATQSVVNGFMQNLSSLVGKDLISNFDVASVEIHGAIQSIEKSSFELDKKIQSLDLLGELLKTFKPYFESLRLRDRLKEVEHDLAQHAMVEERLTAEREIVMSKLRERVEAFFFTDLINAIYSKIDPHPSFKTVQFVADFNITDKPGLNIVLQDERGDVISPMLYFSSAQLNILSLSVFLANALHAKDKNGAPLDVILIDDPIQSMDSINVLATIDLLRNVSARFDKQIIISTHDENFFGLLKRKIPTDVFGSKFLQLESFGVVSQS